MSRTLFSGRVSGRRSWVGASLNSSQGWPVGGRLSTSHHFLDDSLYPTPVTMARNESASLKGSLGVTQALWCCLWQALTHWANFKSWFPLFEVLFLFFCCEKERRERTRLLKDLCCSQVMIFMTTNSGSLRILRRFSQYLNYWKHTHLKDYYDRMFKTCRHCLKWSIVT